MADADWTWGATGWAVLLVVPVVGWLRWHLILRMQGIETGILSTLRIQLIASLFNALLLGSAGGDAVRAYYAAAREDGSRKAVAVTTVVIDRLLGIASLFLILSIGIPVAWRAVFAGRGMAVLGAILLSIYGLIVLVLLLLVIPRFRRRRHRFLARRASKGAGLWSWLAAVTDQMDGALQQLTRRPKCTALCLLISALAHIASMLSFWFFFRALGRAGLPFHTFAVLVPLSLAANALPFSPAGGLGVGELIASEVFRAGAGAALAVGGAAMFMWRMGLCLTAPAGLCLFVLGRDRPGRDRAPGIPECARVAAGTGARLSENECNMESDHGL